MANLKAVATKQKLNSRGYAIDHRPPWEYTENGITISQSYDYERYNEQRENREHRAQHSMLWTKTQPSTANDKDAEAAGIGNWVILNDEHAEELRHFGAKVIEHGAQLVDTKRDFQKLTKLTFFQLSRDLDGAQQRVLGIEQGFYLDLPVTSVRAIKLRIYNLQRKIERKGQGFAFACPNAHDTVRRALKIIGCGQHYDKHINKNQVRRTIRFCNTKSCGQPKCSLRNYHHKKNKYRQNLDTATKAAQQHQDKYRLIQVTVTTDWPLPKGEERLLPKKPTLDTHGRLAHKYKASLPKLNSSNENLYNQRLKEHLTGMRALFASRPAKRFILRTPHRVTETAWLLSSVPGRRAFPNVHTNAVIAVRQETTNQEILKALLPAAKTHLGAHANLHIEEMFYTTEQERSEQVAALGAYDAKEHAVTPATPVQGLTAEDIEFLERLGSDFTPHCTEVAATLDDRSLAEQLEVEDQEADVLYHSDVITLPTEQRSYPTQVVVVHLTPIKKVGNKVKQRRLLFFFNERGKKLRRRAVEQNVKLTPIQTQSCETTGCETTGLEFKGRSCASQAKLSWGGVEMGDGRVAPQSYETTTEGPYEEVPAGYCGNLWWYQEAGCWVS